MTQARSVAEAHEMAHALVVDLIDVPADSVSVELTFEVPGLVEAVEQARRATEEAAAPATGPRGYATRPEYRWRAASPLVPTRAPMADHGIPESRAARTASIRCRSARDRSWMAARRRATAPASSS